jgi:hypothetical protein
LKSEIIRPQNLPKFFLDLHQIFGNFIVLRGYDHLPSGYSNDIDVFIPEQEVKRFINCIKKIKSATANLVILESRLGLMKCELTLDNQVIPFDILYGFYYAGLVYQNTKLLLKQSIIHESQMFSVPSLEDEIRISLLKELLHNRRVRSDKAQYLGEKIQDCSHKLVTSYFDHKAIARIQEGIAHRKLSLPDVSRDIKVKLLVENISQDLFGMLKNISLFFAIKYLFRNKYHEKRYL